MRRSFSSFVVIVLLAGCYQQTPSPKPSEPVAPVAELKGPRSVPEKRPGPTETPITPVAQVFDPVLDGVPQASRQERYDAALIDALNLLADRKLPEALKAVQAAQELQDTEQVQHLIGRIKGLTAEQAAVAKTTQDLRGALEDGKADEVSRLSTSALQQFGGSDTAPALAQIKQQADALVTAEVVDRTDLQRRLQSDAEAALRENNLRAAAISLHQALQIGDDPALRQKLDQVQARVTRYDENRQRAQTIRRDPAQLEEALAALRSAGEAWDTLSVRQEIDDYTLALQRRRDRLAVAAFSIEADLGVPGIGRDVADELLPAFKTRFDLVEREQIGKLLEELRLEDGGSDLGVTGRQEASRLAGVRYLVVGSLSPLNGITARARLVEVKTGLIVQTARVSASDARQLMAQLPMLAQLLMMSDEQKMAFERAQALRTQEIQPIAPIQALPAPPTYIPEQLPPPVLTYSPRPPAFGGLTLIDFNALPPVVVAPPPSTQVVIVREEPRRRLFSLCLELGDNLFRRGRHREAHRHFELALSLTSDRAPIDLRIERCRPFLPPPPPPVVIATQPATIVVSPPVVVARPRLVVFNFLVNCQPGLVPPACGDWTADQFAGCFASRYEVVERGEVCWYMGRLGITMREVLNDPSSRLALAHAMNVRYFVFGAIEQTASLNVTSHLIDAQSGARTGTGMIHVQDHNEMKLRLDELARQIGAEPAEQARLVKQGKEKEGAINDARKLIQAGNFTSASAVARGALKTAPGDVALQSLQQEAETKARQVALAEARRRDAETRKGEAAQAERRQRELAQQAESARAHAEAEARGQGEAARLRRAAQRKTASDQLRSQAQLALRQKNYGQAVQSLQSAMALGASDDIARELGVARVEQEKAAQAQAAERKRVEQAARQAEQEAAQARVLAERKRHEVAEAESRKVQQAHDQARHDQLLAQARQQMERKQYDLAVGSLVAARQVVPSSESNQLLQRAREAKSLEEAEKKGDQAHAEEQAKLAKEKTRRDQAAAAAREKQEAYLTVLVQARQDVQIKKYDEAIGHFREAGKLFATDVVANELRQAEVLRDKERAERLAQERQAQERKQLAQRVQTLLAEGRKAADEKRHDKAIEAFREASRLMPGNVEAVTGLTRGEQAREQQAAEARRLQDAAKRRDAFNRSVAEARTAAAGKRFAEAVQHFNDALKLQPGEPAAVRGLREAEQALKASPVVVPVKPAPPDSKAEFAKTFQAAQAHDKQGRFAEAQKAYLAALQWYPNDPQATAGLHKAEFHGHMSEGQKHLAARRFVEATREYEAALRIEPTNNDARAQLQKAKSGRP